MQYLHKKVILLYVIYRDEILMQESQHQDYKVIDTFAFRLENDFNNQQEISENINLKLYSLFNKRFPYFYKGTIYSTINKEDTVVYITAQTYIVQFDKRPKIISSYVVDVVKGGSALLWVHKDTILNEKRLREGDKKILCDMFQKDVFDIIMIENQGERWIDATLVLYQRQPTNL